MDSELKTLGHVQNTISDMALQFGPKLLAAILILAAGVVAGRWIGRVTERGVARFALEPPVRQLLVRIVRVLVFGLFAIMALQNKSKARSSRSRCSTRFWFTGIARASWCRTARSSARFCTTTVAYGRPR
jgi:Conserved TM helix